MSNYENYTQTSGNYDETRIPVGLEIIVGCLSRSNAPIKQQYLLDAGCGTGNYACAMLSHVKRISAVDMNAGMLERARQKCSGSESAEQIDFHQAAIDNLPFDDAVFDGIMINQVLHHLDLAEKENYPAYRAVFSELARVLKPGGSLIVNTCSHEQLEHGFWYYDLIPDEARSMLERHASLDVLQQIMETSGIAYQDCFVPLDALMQGQAYFDARGPMHKSWRDGDSIWSTVSDDKISEVYAQLEKREKSGQLENEMRNSDARRKHIGQFSFLYGRRS